MEESQFAAELSPRPASQQQPTSQPAKSSAPATASIYDTAPDTEKPGRVENLNIFAKPDKLPLITMCTKSLYIFSKFEFSLSQFAKRNSLEI